MIQILANGLMDLTEGHMTLTILLILWVSAIVSSFLDNIPFVATLIPLILTMQSSGVDVTPPVVGGLPGRLPGRQRHPHRRLGQCGPFGHQQTVTGSPSPLPVTLRWASLDAGLRGHQHRVPAPAVYLSSSD